MDYVVLFNVFQELLFKSLSMAQESIKISILIFGGVVLLLWSVASNVYKVRGGTQKKLLHEMERL